METNKSLVPSSRTNLLPALGRGDNSAVALHLNAFKERGVVRHDKTLRIPSSERIAALTRSDDGYNYVLAALTMKLKSTFDNMNLKRGMNEDQIVELAELIIDESHDDNLALEDVLLFLQQLVTGKAGKILDRMDIPLFFEFFEVYREQRHLAMHYIQYEMHAQFKAMGDNARTSDEYTENKADVRQAMVDYFKQQQQNAQSEPIQPPPAA